MPQKAEVVKRIVSQLDGAITAVKPLDRAVTELTGDEASLRHLMELKKRAVSPQPADVALDLGQHAERRAARVPARLEPVRDAVEEALLAGASMLNTVSQQRKERIARTISNGLARANPANLETLLGQTQFRQALGRYYYMQLEDASTVTQVPTPKGSTSERLVLDERVPSLSESRIQRVLNKANIVEYINAYDGLQQDPDTGPNARTLLTLVTDERWPAGATLESQTERKVRAYKRHLQNAQGRETQHDQSLPPEDKWFSGGSSIARTVALEVLEGGFPTVDKAYDKHAELVDKAQVSERARDSTRQPKDRLYQGKDSIARTVAALAFDKKTDDVDGLYRDYESHLDGAEAEERTRDAARPAGGKMYVRNDSIARTAANLMMFNAAGGAAAVYDRYEKIEGDAKTKEQQLDSGKSPADRAYQDASISRRAAQFVLIGKYHTVDRVYERHGELLDEARLEEHVRDSGVPPADKLYDGKESIARNAATLVLAGQYRTVEAVYNKHGALVSAADTEEQQRDAARADKRYAGDNGVARTAANLVMLNLYPEVAGFYDRYEAEYDGFMADGVGNARARALDRMFKIQ